MASKTSAEAQAVLKYSPRISSTHARIVWCEYDI